MDPITLVIILIFSFGAPLLYRYSRKKIPIEVREEKNKTALPKTPSRPYVLKNEVLSENQRKYYSILKMVLENTPYIILIKPHVREFVYTDKSKFEDIAQFKTYAMRVYVQSADFLICDEKFKPILAIELDELTDSQETNKEREYFINDVYRQIGLKALHVHKYTMESVENQISELLLIRK